MMKNLIKKHTILLLAVMMIGSGLAFADDVIKLGDVDGNGVLNINDVTRLVDYLHAPSTTTINATAADANHDGVINISDVSAVVNILHYGTSDGTTTSTLFFLNTQVEKTFGDEPFTNTIVRMGSTGAITYASDNTNVATVDENTGEVTITHAGSATITATLAADATCAETTASFDLEVSKAENRIVTHPQYAIGICEYNPAGVDILSVPGAALGGQFLYSVKRNGGDWSDWAAGSPKAYAAGTYVVRYMVEGDDDYNEIPYDGGEMAGSMVVSTVAPTVTAAPTAVGDALTYNGSAQTLFNAGSTDDGTLMYKVTTTSEKPISTEGFSAFDESISQRTNAGTYYLWYYVDGDPNHNDTEINATGISMSIGKKSLTVTAEAKSRDYGAENPDLTYTHGDLATGDNETVFTGALECEATAASEPGEYDITQGTLSAGDNYEISYTGAKLTVNLLDMSSGVTVTPYSAAYDGNAHGITIALSGAAEGATITYCDTEDGTYQAENYTYSDVAPARTVWYKIVKEHYTTITGSSTVTITQASNSFTTQPTITGWTYGESANTPTGGVASFGTITYKYCATEDGEYGTYDAIVNGQAGTWYVKGFVEATTNYAAAESDAVSFTISAAAGSISYATIAVEKTLAAPAFTNSLTKVGDGTVTYALSDGDVICAVDATSGEVTLNGNPGSCTITATVTNSSSFSYTKTTASYTLTVLPILDLSLVTANTTVPDGVTITGILGSNYKISIAENATVTLSDVNINGSGTWSSGNYAGLNCLGDVTINLADGTTNTVKGFHTNYPGVHILSGKTLTIQGAGALNASSNGNGAAIGGGYNTDCGNIIINGGTITATGGYFCAGIGAGYDHSCGTITINGGEVTATGGTRGAGIGCTFSNGTCGDITISGGTVTANGGGIRNGDDGGAAGIGGGSYNGNCGNITISGGVVTATGGGGSGNSGGGAGIGGGFSSSCGAITISGGTVIANGGHNGVGIGGGYNKPCGDILISGGTVTATAGGAYSAGIGAGYYSTNGNITIENTVTRVTSTKGANAYHNIGISYNYRGSCGTVTIGGVVGAITTSPYTYIPELDLSTVTSDITVTLPRVITGTLSTKAKISIADGVNVTLKNVNINGSNTWTDGTYPGLSCLGDVTITLEGTNVVRGLNSNYPGLNVVSGKTLTIRGSGSLNAIGDYGSAGIGAGWGIHCGNIRIEGGTITASSGAHASGIGGAAGGGNCGDITITGGSVSVTSGNEASGIGPGKASCGNILISGGTVSATGGKYGAGIGTGYSSTCTCGTITITNGVTKVTATKGNLATNSIGQGYRGTCGTVTIGGVNTGNISTSPYTYQP